MDNQEILEKFLISHSWHYGTMDLIHSSDKDYESLLKSAERWSSGYAEIFIPCQKLLGSKDHAKVTINFTRACDFDAKEWNVEPKEKDWRSTLNIFKNYTSRLVNNHNEFYFVSSKSS